MKILLVKTSSMGDVIHALPVINDIKRNHPNAIIDWLVEENYACIPGWHSDVSEVIPVALRRWRKQGWRSFFSKEFKNFRREMKNKQYDFVIDLQGLLKSVYLARMPEGICYGYDRFSIREPLASFFYNHRVKVSRDQHAVTRIRQLASSVLGYEMPQEAPDFGLDVKQFFSGDISPNLIFFHGSSAPSKLWPEEYWEQLAKIAMDANFHVRLAWGSQEELARSERLKKKLGDVEVLPDLKIPGIAKEIAQASGVIAVDTGFAHLAQAFDIPMVILHGATKPELSGPIGEKQKALFADFPCSPCNKPVCHYSGKSTVSPACFADVTPQKVWDLLTASLAPRQQNY